MKPRDTLNAAEVTTLRDSLERRLQSSGMATQPEVAARILQLAGDSGAGLLDYSGAIRSDAVLAGRLLRLANSAAFAQRHPVTNLDRACVILGLERLKGISLGFCLSRSASCDPLSQLSRRVWGESLFRACLMAELARETVPACVSEAFVVGLMLDAGMPMLVKWLGAPAQAIVEGEAQPDAQFRAESATLPFTHVDIAGAMTRRWRLPALLSRPIELHHAEPPPPGHGDPVHELHRLSHCVGRLRLDCVEAPAGAAPADRAPGPGGTPLVESVRRAAGEHAAMMEVFRDIASLCGDPALLADRAHQQLVEVMDRTMAAQLRLETRGAPEWFTVGGNRVEIECVEPGQAVAYLSDQRGRRLLSHAFSPADHTAQSVLDALGVEDCASEHRTELDRYLRSLAA